MCYISSVNTFQLEPKKVIFSMPMEIKSRSVNLRLQQELKREGAHKTKYDMQCAYAKKATPTVEYNISLAQLRQICIR